MVPVLFALGTNLGDRVANLHRAIAWLRRTVAVEALSAVYETAPMYDTDQPAFLNMCVAARTGLGPEALLARLKAAEAEIGRVPSRPNGPRLIDIDLLLYGDRVVDRPELVVPHPRMAERGFVLAPAADVAAGWRHPVDGRSVGELLQALGPLSGVVRRDDLRLD
ncbi:2-amino-4-hydroxy-6-hydroxymethyldihydropteridine diphosphokinase [Inquilinus limosus]|uniref:2-amino-4-hydroxy-6- hydroxymethyldihydropteridine diphosphokinase n=1 Tax=Inquilinus limosus TaxID=171674 RepID=UPI000415673B|nr:2-amino-4-hydroxy-6-hydroxymethyldihydropteridine diphosphokinase [Inquilinus limosus]